MTAPRIATHTGALNPEQLVSFQSLRDRCNQFEAIELPFYLEGDASDGAATTAFLVFEGSELVAFAHLPDDSIPEACLMVHPGHGRHGLGVALIEATRAELARRDLSEALLVADQSSPSGTAFLNAIAAPYQSSEYRLEFDRSRIDEQRPAVDGLTMHEAARAEADVLVRVLTSAFANNADDARDLVERGFNETGRRFYIASYENEPVGMLRAGEIGGVGDITGFGVLPERQGKGFGRRMLLNAIEMLSSQGLDRIGLEVATENANALGLYKSCGFRIVSEFGFYTLTA